MKRFNDYRARLMFVGFIATILINGGNASADFYFGKPQNLGPVVNSSSPDSGMSLSFDGLTLYFMSTRPGGLGNYDIWVTTRLSISEPWGAPMNLGGPINSGVGEAFPCISADGLTLYFSDYYYAPFRPGGLGECDTWMSTRASQSEPWGAPVNMGDTVNSSAYTDLASSVSHDGLLLVFASTRPPDARGDLYLSARPTPEDPWGMPVNMGPTVNSTGSFDSEACFSPDGLALIFCSNRPGGVGSYDLWMTTRKSGNNPWRPPVNLGTSLNTSSSDGAPAVSPDMKTLYFASSRPGGYGEDDIYEVSIFPVADFNGDGIVAIEDLVRMIESWGKDDPSVDIGPGPWGDGIVDAADLEVLMSYWGQQVDDPTLIAHWALDETEGMIVVDSVGNNDGYALGDPVWQPDGGQVKGALQLDGLNDYVVTGAAPNLKDGPFSILAWIKDGAAGQVILSQMGGANWLCANPSEGALMTELTISGRGSSSLGSQAVITDGNWHRIGFVWDGSYRRLYVDGLVVAEDVQDNLDISSNGLYFGTGKAMELGTFWSGLIDDIRIYNRAVSP